MGQSSFSMNRREFVAGGMATITAGAGLQTAWGDAEQVSANERITIGVIGLGSRGFNLINEVLRQNETQIVAICDVHDLHYRDREWGKGTAYGREPARAMIERKYGDSSKSGKHRGLVVVSDYRTLIDDETIDAIVIATPDHWHAKITLDAIRAGKDVYCEKPVTHTFREGQLVRAAVAKHGTIFQTGSQQRSEATFRQAAELVRNGHLGKIKRIEVGLPPGYDTPQGDATITQPPEGLDYPMWCGPAEQLPYMRARHHRWWRGHTNYGGGVLMDWIGHHNDIAHWSMGYDRTGPKTLQAKGWTWPQTEIYNAPVQYEIVSEYEESVVISVSSRHRQGVTWRGETGNLFVTRGKLDATHKELLRPEFDVGPIKLRQSPGHMRDFVDGVKSRTQCISPVEITHRSITPGHLAYVSQAVGKKLVWSAETETILNDAKADLLLKTMSHREPWTL